MFVGKRVTTPGFRRPTTQLRERIRNGLIVVGRRRVLPPNEAPRAPLLGIVAAQLKVTPAAWSQYARRDEMRREHLQELLERFELRQLDRSYYRELIDWLTSLALQTTQGIVLAHAAAN